MPCDTKNDLKIYAGQCDPYFMVQRLFLITRRLFDREMSYLGYLFHVIGRVTSKYIYRGGWVV